VLADVLADVLRAVVVVIIRIRYGIAHSYLLDKGTGKGWNYLVVGPPLKLLRTQLNQQAEEAGSCTAI
jgi:hypothetical protein